MSILEQLPVSSRPHWQLYSDWCEARSTVPVPASLEQLTSYAQEVPAAFSTTVARIRAVRIAHELAGAQFPYPVASPVSAVRSGEGWTSIPDAIAAVPVTRYPAGLVGRRDAFVLLLLDRLRLSRRRIRAVAITDVDVRQWTIAGARLQWSEPVVTCERCVLSRWLRVLGPAALGMRFSTAEALDPTRHSDEHDCELPLDDGWIAAPTLLPAIDRYGWLDNHRALSTRSISAITARRQDLNVEPADNHPQVRLRSPAPTMSLQDVADAYDDLDERVTALLLFTRDLVIEMDSPIVVQPGADRPQDAERTRPGSAA
ncbi:hypothetical protein HQQ81_21315 [Microbacteriaceae bacterium VKM Ac-2854]|nr:hypothetical protein [Microbacteriaceae bacterium VKM Ac-2854]